MVNNNYKRLGDYIQQVNVRNRDLEVTTLLGVSNTKKMIPSIANTIGTDMSTYKIIEKRQFAYGTVTSRNGDRLSVAISDEYEKALVSQIYVVFEVIDTSRLLPAYLMMWFSRPEFDRYARFHSHGSTRETFDWDDMCDVELPVPSIEEQREIVAEYQHIENMIRVNEQICEKLEATAQALYKHWFVDFEFPNEEGQPYKSSGGKMVWNQELEKEIPEGWELLPLSNYIAINSGFAFKSDWWAVSGLPVIKIGTIKNNSICELELDFVAESNNFKKEQYYVNKGDIVIAMTGFTMGKMGLVPDFMPKLYVNQRVGYFKSGNSDYQKTGYLFCVLNTHDFQNAIWSFGGDSQQFNVSNEQVESIKILQPNSKGLIKKFNLMTEPVFERLMFAFSANRCYLKLQSLLLSCLATLEDKNLKPITIENLECH